MSENRLGDPDAKSQGKIVGASAWECFASVQRNRSAFL